jgi:tripartite-type tricarboxylate transporter receptor subunit TctC
MKRKILMAAAAVFALGICGTALPTMAQTYPTKPVKVVVPFPAGGAADLTMRLLSPKLADQLGQPFVIENKPGANGIIGTEMVASAQADGHTLLFAPREVFGINPVLQPTLPYDPIKSFSHIGIVTEGPYVLIANPALSIKSIDDLVALAKTKELSYASFGIGSMGHLNLEALTQRLGIKMRHIPYKGAPPAVQAVVAGEVAIAIATAPSILGLLSDGKLTALAVGSEQRLALLPGVRTMVESGVPSDVVLPASFALAAPAGTPSAIVDRLAAAVSTALTDPAIADRLAASGLVGIKSSPDRMRQAVRDDLKRFSAQVKALDIKVE